MAHAFEFDPCQVLGVGPEASLQELRDAYRAKAKKYHPDHGGDEWIFRVIHRSFEILSTARVAARTREAPAASRPTRSPSPSAPPPPPEAGRARPGVQDSVADPLQLVDVELLNLRFELETGLEIFMESAEDRNLSCSLNLTWPDRDLAPQARGRPEAEAILRDLTEVLDLMSRKTRVIASRSSTDGGRFTGWLSYPTVARASAAFQVLRAELNARGLGVRQWNRDMLIPRSWR